jgi:hypothetical protein
VAVYKRLGIVFALSLLLLAGLPGTAHAADKPVPERGLLIAPLREYPKGNAGETVHADFTVANLTDKPLDVRLSVKQFSVTDYAYDYTFAAPKDDWLHLETPIVTLLPNKSRSINYTITIPAKAAPGGHYYTLFASADLESQGIRSTIQAADLLYLTVAGKLNTVSHLQHSSISVVNFGRNINYTLEPINTGNVYSFVYVSGQLHGLFVRPAQTSVAHMLIPGKVRRITDSIPSPIFPGIYNASYGYKNDAGWVIQQSHLIVYIPPWFIAFVLAGLLVAGKFWHRRRTYTDGTPDDPDEETLPE